jgi:hypothetical protein
VTFPNSITNLGDDVFEYCPSLTNIDLPYGIASIPTLAFYNCPSLAKLKLPSGLVSVEAQAFDRCSSLDSVTIPAGVKTIGDAAFGRCLNLTNVYFLGNSPDYGQTEPFIETTNAIAYYLPGTSGWNSTFAGQPAFLWNPTIQTGDGGFGVQNNQFDFNIVGTTNIPIAVEASTDLTNPNWIRLQSAALTNGQLRFSDQDWMNHPNRFYRITTP